MAKGLISVSNQYSISNLHLITRHEVIELPRRETKLELSVDDDLLHFKRIKIGYLHLRILDLYNKWIASFFYSRVRRIERFRVEEIERNRRQVLTSSSEIGGLGSFWKRCVPRL
ncbi:uncharacterized protein LOC112199863 isoform X1 [Rosa chinensis]|uniref:uncharacterized protein LOC112199863 isoform X1 n=1 Tax=Rosa chinensis TaxID=74649 RepID=UPI001AD90C01|nr:uncharacterized protein LOC112199863 isoform X1 [Rosa chinensis]